MIGHKEEKKSANIRFLIYYLSTRSHVIKRVLQLHGWEEPHSVSHNPVEFGGHGYCESEDTAFLICHMTTLSNGYMTWSLGIAPISHHPVHFCQLLL